MDKLDTLDTEGQFYPFISYNSLLRSSPFGIYPYLEYSYGLVVDKSFSEDFSVGVNYMEEFRLGVGLSIPFGIYR